MADFIQQLSGGHPNSLGRTSEVVETVLNDRKSLDALFETLESSDPTVRMRAGDAIEKVARVQPAWFDGHYGRVIATMGSTDQASLQWHTAQLLTAIPLTPEEQTEGVEWLWRTFENTSDWIVISEVLTALAHFAPSSESIRERLPGALRGAQDDSRAAVAKRATKLLKAMREMEEAGPP